MGKLKSLKNMTKVEARKESKKRAQEAAEELDTLGQENETKAAKWIIEKGKEEDKKESERQATAEWKLHDAKGKLWTYNEELTQEAIRMILSHDIPPGYRLAPKVTDKGLMFAIRDKEGNWYAKGMTISGIPKYDLNGLVRTIERAVSFIDELEDNSERNPKDDERTTIIT